MIGPVDPVDDMISFALGAEPHRLPKLNANPGYQYLVAAFLWNSGRGCKGFARMWRREFILLRCS